MKEEDEEITLLDNYSAVATCSVIGTSFEDDLEGTVDLVWVAVEP